MHSLNDLVVVGNEQFFFANYFHTNDMLELILRLRWGSFGYFDGDRSTLVETGLLFPNGLSMSPDGKLVYATVFLCKTLNPLMGKAIIVPSNNMKLVHWPLIGGLLHLVR